jgi:SseB protein N-terminal domain/SseB protein C-terminal domain
MLPIDPTDGPGGGVIPMQPLPVPPAAQASVPQQATAHGGTFIRPGAMAWGGTGDAPDGAYSSCETVEQALAEAVKDASRLNDLLDELTRARLWVPLPADGPITDGSAVALPTVTYLGAEFVPCFTSLQSLSCWPDRPEAPSLARQRTDDALAGDAAMVPHIVVPAAELARRLPAGLGLAVNPGAEASVPIYPEGVGYLAKAQPEDDLPVQVGHPPTEPEELLRAVRGALRPLPTVRQASRAWLSVPGEGEGLIISVALDDPASEPAHQAALRAIEQAVAAVPLQAPFPIDVTFPGEAEPDLVDEWVAGNTDPFYTRD